MSRIINDVRQLMNTDNVKSMNANEIFRRLSRTNLTNYGMKQFKKDNLMDVLNHYGKLSVIHIDQEENVIFL